MKRYIGVKIVKAFPMTRECAETNHKVVVGGNNHGDGYIVEYDNGYRSWSPKDVFDAAYRPTDNLSFGLAIEAMKKGHRVARKGWNGRGIFIAIQPGFDIEVAAERSHTAWMDQKLSQGFTSRKAEDGEELMVPYTELSEKQKEMDRTYVRRNDAMTSDFIYIDTTGLLTDNPYALKSKVPWLASQTDMLADDWQIVSIN